MIKYFSIALLLIIIGAGFIYGPNLIRLNNMLNLYNEDKISYNFINMKEIFNYTSPIKASEKPYTFETAKYDLPESFISGGRWCGNGGCGLHPLLWKEMLGGSTGGVGGGGGFALGAPGRGGSKLLVVLI